MMACPLDTTNFFFRTTKSHFSPIKAPLLCNLHKPAIAYVTLQFLVETSSMQCCQIKQITHWVSNTGGTGIGIYHKLQSS